MITKSMDKIKATLAERLAVKGLQKKKMGLFIKDVIRIVSVSPGFNLETIKGQLQLLGWQDDYADYGTIQLIQACYEDG
jgi:hypothetical protein